MAAYGSRPAQFQIVPGAELTWAQAPAASAGVTVNAGLASATGWAAVNAPPAATTANAGLASASAAALFTPGTTIGLTLTALNPVGAAGSALNATVTTVSAATPAAGQAAGTGAAPQPTVVTSAARNAPAGQATGTGTAPGSSVVLAARPAAGQPAGTGTAAQPAVSIRATFGSSGLAGVFLNNTGLGVADFNAASALWQSWAGTGVPVTRVYHGAGYGYTTDMTQMVAAGVKMCIDFTPAYNPVSATDLANLTALMATLQAAGAVCEISLWHEPDYSGLTAAQYVAMIQYYGPTVRSYYPLVCVFAGPDADISNGYYPGDAWCDGIAADGYAQGSGLTTITNAASIADGATPPKRFSIWELNSSPGANSLTGDNYSFAATIGNYLGAGNCVTTHVTLAGPAGAAGSLAATSAAAGDMAAASAPAANYATQMLACAPGDEIFAAGWVKAAVSPRACVIGATFYAPVTGTLIGTVYSSDTSATATDSASAWTGIAGTVTAPAGSAWCRLSVKYLAAGAAGEVHYFNLAQLANSTSGGQTKAQAASFFGTVQGLMAGRWPAWITVTCCSSTRACPATTSSASSSTLPTTGWACGRR